MDDWGVLRAWAWGDSRVMDFLATDKDVDAKKVGVMGHSRGGKAALVALVDDPRFAIGFISSSGAGGADLYRRNYGEQMANIGGNSEFHWFAGNFLRYDQVGHSANEMPVDSHDFIALAAPRAVFIGGGALIATSDYAPGDAWQDAQGMFMAVALASPAWKFYGKQGLGLGASDFPAMETLVDSGDVAFRQHPYGHTPAPNWPAFIDFAAKEFAKQKK
jgi:pimeloyl-ACP methyl ester carboxylesterase